MTEAIAKNEILFMPSLDETKWVMKISEEGILFNRETYPDSTVDDFAQAVISILEESYTNITFRKTCPHSNP